MTAIKVQQLDGEEGEIRAAGTRCAKWLKVVVFVLLGLMALGAGLEFFRVTVGSNLHVVIPGKVYRSAQPTEELLSDLIKKYGIKTVVNLRGTSPLMPWYQDEAEATCELDLDQEDLNLSAGRLPSTSELKELIEVLDRVQYPILLHCRRGADRTGLAAAAVMLLQEGVTLSQARNQLSWRAGHIQMGRPARMAFFFDIYQDWLKQQNLEHSPIRFRHWALQEYRGGPCRCTFESYKLSPETIRTGQPFSIRLRIRNTGSLPWRFNPMPSAGVNLACALFDPDGGIIAEDRAGFFHAQVEPGDSIDLTLPVEALDRSGQYRLFVDMVDEQMGVFFQMGSEPLELRLDVGE